MMSIDENGNYVNCEDELQTAQEPLQPTLKERVEALENAVLDMIVGDDSV